MKKTLLIAFLCAVALPAYSQTFSARYGRRGQRPPTPAIQPSTEGSLQKAVKAGGNPLQLINPKAPREYGSGADVVVYTSGSDPSQSGRNTVERPTAVRLLSFYFW